MNRPPPPYRPTPAGPPAAPRLASLLQRGAIVAVLCVVVAAVLYAIERQPLGRSVVYSLCVGLPCWLIIDLARLLLARQLHRRNPHRMLHPEWPGWGRMAGCILVGVAVAFPLGHRLGDWLTGSRSLHPGAELRGVAPALLISLVAALVATWFFYSRGRLASAEAAAESARRLATEHQLRLLESQLEPHMLFNTLANLRALIGLDATRAQLMLDRLNAFLRATLSASRVERHPLAAEFERLADYLALMQVRMGERLQPRFELPATLARLPVPPLLLQPLVENAIKHGLEPALAGGQLLVSAHCEGQRLWLSVRDTGVGLQPSGAARDGGGFGLDLVRQRLQALYGDTASLELSPVDAAGGGTLARIGLPLPLHDNPHPHESDRADC
ncbi:sensor histidine kinase [Eleftheria terrae]|uniref:sensor histidine kinase n=1 Tax=Eleftheria terrae TaxID=1597781 RepID=UPI00263AEEB8|nr:histidine kinase [Eleftheria terrae]WKB52525.1 histidine kinase [Eleftheria terrae]